MKRRLFFLFPNADHTRVVVEELRQSGIDSEHMHAVGRKNTDLTALPPPTLRQRNDVCCRVENWLWNANLALFAVALLVLAAASWQGFWLTAFAALVVGALSLVAGERFAATIPRVHLREFREAIAHGDVLLMVDVARERVAEVEELVHRRHPEGVVGGVGWSMSVLEH